MCLYNMGYFHEDKELALVSGFVLEPLEKTRSA